MATQPFEVRWEPAAVARILERVAATELPASIPGSGWTYGCDVDYLRHFQQYWVNDYDWRNAVGSLNRHPQFVTTMAGLDIHFVHVKGEGAQAGKRPLLLTHGWPGSHHEFWQVIEPLAFPSRFGGSPGQAFDLVIPTLPGYAFSGKPAAPTGPRATARLWNTLMTDVLGYPSYRAQGGDWGSIVTSWLGVDHAASLDGIHLNMLPFQSQQPPASDEERQWIAQAGQAKGRLGAYAGLQATRPQSIGMATADNPLGQAAWILERFHDWSDLRTRAFEDVFRIDDLVTNVMLYVMTGSFASAAWFYAGMAREGPMTPPEGRPGEAPTAYTAYADPLLPPPPRSRAEQVYRIARWAQAPSGGHFAAMENPSFFVSDLRSWAG